MPTNETTAFARLGMLDQRRAHQQPAVAAADDRQLLARRVLPLDQVLEHRGEIVEHVLLLREIAVQVPGLAVLAAAADVGDRDHEAVVEQDPAVGR